MGLELEWWDARRRLRNAIARREIFGGCGWKAVAEFMGEIKDWSRAMTVFLCESLGVFLGGFGFFCLLLIVGFLF